MLSKTDIAIATKTPLFASLSPSQFQDLCETAMEELKILEPGEVLVRMGSSTMGLTLVLWGNLRSSYISSRGQQRVVQEVAGPGVVGAPLLYGPETMTEKLNLVIEAMTRAKVLRFNGLRFKRWTEKNPLLVHSFLEYCAARFIQLFVRNQILTGGTLRQKLADYLLERCDHDGRVAMDAGLDHVAAYLGVERPSLSAVLGEFVALGALAREGRGRYRIMDKNALMEL